MIEKICLQAPPNTLFDGVTTNYMDNLTYQEFLLGILKKLNETIIQVNSNTEFIDNYSGQIQDLEKQIAEIKIEIENQYNEITSETDLKIANVTEQLQGLVYNATNEAKSYTNVEIAKLQQQIDNIILGQIEVYDPTSGTKTDLQTALNNIYDSSREFALTADEYDGLDLTATVYDLKLISAFDYDNNARKILMA